MRSEAFAVLKETTVLLAEDDPVTQNEISEILGFYFKTVFVASDGVEAYRLYKENRVDVLITDVMMNAMDGLALVRKIREDGFEMPIIMITSHTSEALLLRAVTLKLTGYIKKPYSLQHIKEGLALCANELLKSASQKIKLDDGLFYDAKNALLLVQGEKVSLTNKESRLLSILLKSKNSLLSKEQITDFVWEGGYVSDNAFKNLILRLRKKIGFDKIVSMKGLGYKFHIAS